MSSAVERKQSVASFLTGGLSLLTVISGLVLINSMAFAEGENGVTASLIITNACELSTSVDESHTDSVNVGTYSSDIGTTTFTVFCNDNSGFSVYAIGYSDDQFGNNKLVATINGSLYPAYDIVTGTATSGNTSNWAMKLDKVSGAYAPTITGETQGDIEDFTDYHAVPSTYTKVATFSSTTDATIGSSIESTYAVFINPLQPAGTYNGKVRYTLVHPASEVPTAPEVTEAGKICYYPNGGNVVGVMNTCQNVASTVMLYPSNFSREGYGYAGWSTTYDYSDPTGFYGPAETITLNTADYSGSNNGLSLYAYWVKAEVGVTLQSFNPSDPAYAGKEIGSVMALRDERDSQVYAVARLADGKWWMIENLRLDTLGSNSAAGAQGFGGVFAGLANAEPAWSISSTAANSLYSTDGTTAITITGNNLASRIPRFYNQNTVARSSSYSPGGNVYSYGNYYTWSAVMANTNDYNSYTAEVDGHTSETAGTSICPHGWMVPYGRNINNGNTPGGLYYLNYKINNDTNLKDGTASNNLRKYPNNFSVAGILSNQGSFYAKGTDGYYWSSSASSSDNTYGLYYMATVVNPGTTTYYKAAGIPVRCVKTN